MRILWIIHDVPSRFITQVKVGSPTIGGSWIAPLLDTLLKNKGIKIGILVPIVSGEYSCSEIDGATFFSIPIKSGDNSRRLNKLNTSFYLKAIEEFKPDLVHFHGTEKNFGLIREFVAEKIPLVGSIQGIINSYLPYIYMSSSNMKSHKYKSLKNWIGRGGVNFIKRKWKRYVQIERDIFRMNKYFIGRTLWDKSQLAGLNPSAYYFHGEELLRDEFAQRNWCLNECDKNTIFISSGAYPIKGLHILIKALKLLKSKFPNIKVFVPLFHGKSILTLKDRLWGEEYSNYILSLISNFELHDNVVLLGRLSAGQMADYYTRANVFVLPSFVENSPNSLGEAMTVGVPTVVAYNGGIGSILENEKDSLFFPIGDVYSLAFQIERLFLSPQLATKLSDNAKKVAGRRHNVEKTEKQYVDIYRKIIDIHNESFTSF